MNSLTSLVFPAVLGLIAGVGHGIISHQAGFPLSLTEQFLQPLQIGQAFQD